MPDSTPKSEVFLQHLPLLQLVSNAGSGILVCRFWPGVCQVLFCSACADAVNVTAAMLLCRASASNSGHAGTWLQTDLFRLLCQVCFSFFQ